MKNLIKFIWKRLTCDHDYWWNYKATWGKEFGDHELIEISCRCEKCGKEKKIKFKKKVLTNE
jgi:hypothetical protein